MSIAHKLGRPEWAAEDDEAAEEYAASLKSVAAPDAASGAASQRQEWAHAAQYYWAAAYAAMHRRDISAMRENAHIARDADKTASPEGALKAAIFGGCERRAPERPAALGRSLPRADVAAARAAVTAEIRRLDAAAAAAKAAQIAANKKADAAAAAAAARDRQVVVASTLVIGERHTARVPYRLSKKSEGLCYIGDMLVAVAGVADGDEIIITSNRTGRDYGLRYEAEGKMA